MCTTFKFFFLSFIKMIGHQRKIHEKSFQFFRYLKWGCLAPIFHKFHIFPRKTSHYPRERGVINSFLLQQLQKWQWILISKFFFCLICWTDAYPRILCIIFVFCIAFYCMPCRRPSPLHVFDMVPSTFLLLLFVV